MTSLTLYESAVTSNIFLSPKLYKKKFKNNYGNSSHIKNKIKLFERKNNDPHCNNPIIKTLPNDKLLNNVEIRIITKNCNNKKLIGSKGVFTKKNVYLSKYTILGFFNGTRYTIDEYRLFGSKKFENYSMTTCHDTIIDPTDKDMIFKYINDGRKNVYNKNTEKYFNVEPMQVVINHIPSVVIYTIDYIGPNRQLYMDYGQKYWSDRK